MRTVSGHASNCVCLDFHPCGEFFASGSVDSALSVWDTRRSESVLTFKGHRGGVNCLRFSPDGQWVVSGGEDGVMKVREDTGVRG